MSRRDQFEYLVLTLQEKNLIMVNILRDLIENEEFPKLSTEDSDADFARIFMDKAVRRNEILAEIKDFLTREGALERFDA